MAAGGAFLLAFSVFSILVISSLVGLGLYAATTRRYVVPTAMQRLKPSAAVPATTTTAVRRTAGVRSSRGAPQKVPAAVATAHALVTATLLLKGVA